MLPSRRSEKPQASDGLLFIDKSFLVYHFPWLNPFGSLHLSFIVCSFCFFQVRTYSEIKTMVFQIIDHIGIYHATKIEKSRRVGAVIASFAHANIFCIDTSFSGPFNISGMEIKQTRRVEVQISTPVGPNSLRRCLPV